MRWHGWEWGDMGGIWGSMGGIWSDIGGIWGGMGGIWGDMTCMGGIWGGMGGIWGDMGTGKRSVEGTDWNCTTLILITHSCSACVQYCYSGVWLDSSINSPTFANKEAYLQNVGLLVNCRIQSNPTVTVLYLVSLLFVLQFLHPTNHFLDGEVLYLLAPVIFLILPGVLRIQNRSAEYFVVQAYSSL